MAIAIAGFSSRRLPEEAVTFAKAMTRAVMPANVARARALLFATSRLAAFGLSVGLCLEPEVLLSASVIERFVLRGTATMSGATKRTLRTNLRHVAASVDPRGRPQPVALPRERSKLAYSASEIASYLALADAQPTSLRRLRAGALICLGAGAGLTGADLRSVRGTDVVSRSGGLVVVVSGRRPRVVPVLSCYHERLEAAADLFAERYLLSDDPKRHNVTTPLISSLSGGYDLARLDTGRLRATWLAACAEALGLRSFMDAAGISCSQRLGDLVGGLAPTCEERAVVLLGGRS